MTLNVRVKHSPASLMTQIAETERKILDQQRLVSLRASLLDRSIRRRVTSPTWLLLAIGVGFITGKLTHRYIVERKEGSRHIGGIGGAPAPGASFLDTALKVVSLVGSFVHAMPSAAKGPSPRSETSGDMANQRSPSGASSGNPTGRSDNTAARWSTH